VAVVGVPDARTGERACAVVVLVAGSKKSPTVTDLGDFLAEQGVARFKVPEQVVVWDALPRNDAGKVLKHRMRDALVGSRGDTACR
jgi:non-ribosomal peptide synthetase component E (peptide arylation enzyme)